MGFLIESSFELSSMIMNSPVRALVSLSFLFEDKRFSSISYRISLSILDLFKSLETSITKTCEVKTRAAIELELIDFIS